MNFVQKKRKHMQGAETKYAFIRYVKQPEGLFLNKIICPYSSTNTLPFQVFFDIPNNNRALILYYKFKMTLFKVS